MKQNLKSCRTRRWPEPSTAAPRHHTLCRHSPWGTHLETTTKNSFNIPSKLPQNKTLTNQVKRKVFQYKTKRQTWKPHSQQHTNWGASWVLPVDYGQPTMSPSGLSYDSSALEGRAAGGDAEKEEARPELRAAGMTRYIGHPEDFTPRHRNCRTQTH